ncbi:hypothetical protein D3C86_2227710 [compost metagenome]
MLNEETKLVEWVSVATMASKRGLVLSQVIARVRMPKMNWQQRSRKLVLTIPKVGPVIMLMAALILDKVL